MALNIDQGFQERLKYNHHEPAADTDAEAFAKVVESRRSVRIFDGTPVPEQVMRRCLDLALLAPSSSNMQAWEFHWVRTPSKRTKLVRSCMSQPAATTAAELVVCVARTGTWRKHRATMLRHLGKDPSVPKSAIEYYKYFVPMVYTQGVGNSLAAVKYLFFNGMGIFKPMPREPNFHSGMREWAVKSSCLASSILMLALRAHGFDSCPMEGVDQRRVERLLELPSDACVPMVLGVGKRAPEGVYGPRVRFDRRWFIKEV